MSLINEKIEILLKASNIKYYEKLGYEIPRINKNHKISIPNGTKIKVKIKDLPKSSNVYVDVKCDCDGCNNIKKISYSKYIKILKEMVYIYALMT